VEQYKAIIKELKIEHARLKAWVKLLKRELRGAGVAVPDEATLALHDFDDDADADEGGADAAAGAGASAATASAAAGPGSAVAGAGGAAAAATEAAPPAAEAASSAGTVTVHLTPDELGRISNLIAINKGLEAQVAALSKDSARRRRRRRRRRGDREGGNSGSEVSDLSDDSEEEDAATAAGSAGRSASLFGTPPAASASLLEPQVCAECREFGLVADADADAVANTCSVCGIEITEEELCALRAAHGADGAAESDAESTPARAPGGAAVPATASVSSPPAKPSRAAAAADESDGAPALPPRAGFSPLAIPGSRTSGAASSKEAAVDKAAALARAITAEARVDTLTTKLRNRDDNLKFLELSMTEYTAMYRTSIVEHQMKQTKLEATIDQLRGAITQMKMDAEREAAEAALASPGAASDWLSFEAKLESAARTQAAEEGGVGASSPRVFGESDGAAAAANGTAGIRDRALASEEVSPQPRRRESPVSKLFSSLVSQRARSAVPKTLRGRKGAGGSKNPIKTLRGEKRT
jgi:hypothetical protein